MSKGNIVKKTKSIQSFQFNGSSADGTLRANEASIGINKTVVPTFWKANEQYLKGDIVFCTVEEKLKLYKALKNISSEIAPNSDPDNWKDYTVQFYCLEAVKAISDGNGDDITLTYQKKQLKTNSTTEYKVLSDNNFTDEDKKLIHTHENKEILDGITKEKVSAWDNKAEKKNVLQIWKPNTKYIVGEHVSVVVDNVYRQWICNQNHVSSDDYKTDIKNGYWTEAYVNLAECAHYSDEATIAYESNYAKSAECAHYSDEATIAYESNYAKSAECAYFSDEAMIAYEFYDEGTPTLISDKFAVKSDKTTFATDNETRDIVFDMAEAHNKVTTYLGDITSLTIVFPNTEYDVPEYHSNVIITPASGDPTIEYTKTGILTWVGADCSVVEDGTDEDGNTILRSLFIPSAGYTYDIIFSFDGKGFVARVDRYKSATVSGTVSE